MKVVKLTTLLEDHGPEELDTLLYECETEQVVAQLVADSQDGRPVAYLVPAVLLHNIVRLEENIRKNFIPPTSRCHCGYVGKDIARHLKENSDYDSEHYVVEED